MNVSSTDSGSRFPWRRALGFLLVAALLLKALGALFDFAARRDLRSKWHWLLDKRGGDYDFAVLGSSRAYMGVDVSVLETELGQRGVNLGLPGAGSSDELLAFQCFLRHNRVRGILLDASLNALDRRGFDHPFHEYEYLPYQGDPLIDSALRKECGPKALLWKYVPFWRNAEFNTKIGPIQFYTLCKAPFDPGARVGDCDDKGCRLVMRPFVQRSKNVPERWAVEPDLLDGFVDIIRFAESQGISVTLTLTPELRSRTVLQLNRDELLDTYRQVAAAHQLKFLVFDDLPLVEDKAFFVDTSHLNIKGARLYTKALADRLKVSAQP